MFEEYNIFWGKQPNGQYTLNHWGSHGDANFLQKNPLPRYASCFADTFKEGGANIKRLADELGLRYIKVVACDED